MASHMPENEFYAAVALVIVDGPMKGRRFPLKDGRNLIGRSAECDVVLEDDGVSRQHAAVTVGEAIEIEDVGSAQGTRHNDRLLVAKDFLFDNDEIRVGAFFLRLEARRRESRKGISFAVSCLVVAAAFLLVALLLPEKPVIVRTSKSEADMISGEASWHNWSNLTLPTREQLREENIPVDAASAWEQYRTGTRLYLDRLSDLRNPSRGIAHFKRALAIAELLPVAERPAFSHRAITRTRELQEMILENCNHRIFVTHKHYQMGWRSEALRALEEIQYLTQWPDCRYYHWADREMRRIHQQVRRR